MRFVDQADGGARIARLRLVDFFVFCDRNFSVFNQAAGRRKAPAMRPDPATAAP
jgi:hypothetical protein